MKRRALLPACALVAMVLASGCGGTDLVGPVQDLELQPSLSVTQGNACWGQATAVFAQMGAMGEHASQQATPRDGLRNLARLLYDAGVIADDSMSALGAFVAGALGLSIEACMP